MRSTKILIVASNPNTTAPLALLKEAREIEDAIQSSYYRDAFEVHHCLAARASDLRRKVLGIRPDIIHFCAHGSDFGVYLENDSGAENLVLVEQLIDFLCEVGSVKCLLLNSCHSLTAGRQASKHIPVVICFEGKLVDKAAISFSKGFYESIAGGDEVKKSYKLGLNAIAMDFKSSDTELYESHRSLYLGDKNVKANPLASGYCFFINHKEYRGKPAFAYVVLFLVALIASLVFTFRGLLI